MPDRLYDDPTIPPPGRRHGEGSASILPYLVKTLAAKPMAVPGAALLQPAPWAGEPSKGAEQQD